MLVAIASNLALSFVNLPALRVLLASQVFEAPRSESQTSRRTLRLMKSEFILKTLIRIAKMSKKIFTPFEYCVAEAEPLGTAPEIIKMRNTT